MSLTAMAELWDGGAEGLTFGQRWVAMAVADVVNDANDNEFWMRSSDLAEKCGMDRSAVRHKMRELVNAGWLEVVTPGGGRVATRYRWAGNPGIEPCANNTAQDSAPQSSRAQSTREPCANNTAAVVVLADSEIDTSYRTQKEPKRNSTTEFDVFWRAYPKRKKKGDALKAFPAALKLAGGLQPLLDGINRAMPDWLTQDIRFTPYPATWLRSQGWEDESMVDLEAQRKQIARAQARVDMGLPADPYAIAIEAR